MAGSDTITANKPAWGLIGVLASVILSLVAFVVGNFRSDVQTAQDIANAERIEEKLDRLLIQGKP